MNLYKDIERELNRSSIRVDSDIYDLIYVWNSWYRGNVEDFHTYNQKLADGSTVSCDRLTMNMPKKLAEDFAKLLWSEKAEIRLDTDEKTERLLEILDDKDNNFGININKLIERGMALGTSAAVEYLDSGRVKIDYLQAQQIMPFNYSNGTINGLVTINRFTDGLLDKKLYFTHLTIHQYSEGIYTKLNRLFKSADENALGDEISFEIMFPEVANPVVIETEHPHFQVFTPNIANNLDYQTPMGMSVFANSVDRFKAIDMKYDSFTNEFELGKKMVLVDRTALKETQKVVGDQIVNVSYFDKNNKSFVAINGMENQPVREIDFSLRVDEHINALNAELNYLSSAVGLGQNFYSFDASGLKTATEVVSEKSDTFRTKVTHQIILRDFLFGLVSAVCELAGIEQKDINIVFDDSIIEDKNAEIERGLKLYEKGLISRKTFLRDYMEYSDEQIEEEITNSMRDIKTVVELLGSDIIDQEKALELVFGDMTEEERVRILANTGNIAFEPEVEDDTEELEV